MREFRQAYKHILLVDDDSDDRDLFAEAISFIDPTIFVTMKRDGEELMEYLKTCSVQHDLIFLDLNMPKKNGKECLVEVKADEHHGTTPVIIYTTSLNPIDIEETFSKGASLFLRKPNSFEELKVVLDFVLRSRLYSSERKRETFLINASF